MTSSESGNGTRSSEGSSEEPSSERIAHHHNRHRYGDSNRVIYNSVINIVQVRRHGSPHTNSSSVPNSDIDGIALQPYPHAVSNQNPASHLSRPTFGNAEHVEPISRNAEHVEPQSDAEHMRDARNDGQQGELLEDGDRAQTGSAIQSGNTTAGAAVTNTTRCCSLNHRQMIMLVIVILAIVAAIVVPSVEVLPKRTESPNNDLKSSKIPLSIDTTHSMLSSAVPSSASEVLTHGSLAPMTTQPSPSKLPYASSSISSIPPFSATTDAALMTSLIFGVTAPPKTITNGTMTSICTPWSGLGCAGDICHAQTCEGVLPCWNGRCCMTACLLGWECTAECADGLSCSKAAESPTGRCTTTDWINTT